MSSHVLRKSRIDMFLLRVGLPLAPVITMWTSEVLLPEDADLSNNALSKSITYTYEFGHER